MVLGRRYRAAGAVASTLLLAGFALTGCSPSAPEGVVTVLATMTGTEEKNFRQVLDRFEQETGIRAEYEGTRAVTQVLRSAVQQGAPPDIAIVPSPQDLVEYVERGQLQPLDRLDQAPYSEQWLHLQRMGQEEPYAVAVKVELKSLVWHRTGLFPNHPATWDGLIEVSRQIAKAGRAPWCMGMESAPTSGWPGTDWIEDILLHRWGPAIYGQWAAGELKWTSPEVTEAWNEWYKIVGDPQMVQGGAGGAMLSNFRDAGVPLVTGDEGCVLEHQASFMLGFYRDHFDADQLPDTGGQIDQTPEPLPVDFFDFPSFGSGGPEQEAVLVSADLAGMFNDTPQARALMTYLATTDAQKVMPTHTQGRTFSANTNVYEGGGNDLGGNDQWAEVTSGAIAERLTDGSRQLCFDASDLMPAAMRTAFYHAVLRYVQEAPSLRDEPDAVRDEALRSLLERLDLIREDLKREREVWFDAHYPCGAR